MTTRHEVRSIRTQMPEDGDQFRAFCTCGWEATTDGDRWVNFAAANAHLAAVGLIDKDTR